MTAIGLVGLADGFVIGADGRMSRADETKPLVESAAGMETEDARKIFEVIDAEKKLAYGISGFVTMDEFRALDEFRKKTKWLAQREFADCKRYLAAVTEKVTEEINEAKHDKRIENFPTSRRTESGNGYKIIDLILAGYYRGVPSLNIAQITHANGTEAKWDVNSYDPKHCILLGSDALRKAMYPDHGEPDRRFAQYRKWPIESLSDAQTYVKGYIEASSSDLGREVDPEHWRITGGRLHMAKITPAGGFEWVIPPKDASCK